MLEFLIRDFNKTAVDLAQQIAAEEERTKIKDTRHVAYSTFAKAAALRRRNLLISVADLKPRLEAAKHELNEVMVHLPDDPELAQSHAPSIYVPPPDQHPATSTE